jgi:hypothetical protein
VTKLSTTSCSDSHLPTHKSTHTPNWGYSSVVAGFDCALYCGSKVGCLDEPTRGSRRSHNFRLIRAGVPLARLTAMNHSALAPVFTALRVGLHVLFVGLTLVARELGVIRA